MKKTQRVSIELLHREVVIAMEGSVTELRDDEMKEAGSAAWSCEVCGSPWIAIAVQGGEQATTPAESIHRALEKAGMHLHVDANGGLSICRKSLEDLKEKR